jgi:heat shock protein HslJ
VTEPLGPLPSLRGTRWLLAELDGEKVGPGDGERAPHVVLDADEPRVSGSGGCNRLIGSFELTEGGLRIGPVTTTLMACDEEVMRREAAFTAALEAATRYEIEGTTLSLLDEERVRARLVVGAATVE